jgi:hypothetical protein
MRMSHAGAVAAGAAVLAVLALLVYLAYQALSAVWALVVTVLIVAALGTDATEVNAHGPTPTPALVDAVHAAGSGVDRHP